MIYGKMEIHGSLLFIVRGLGIHLNFFLFLYFNLGTSSISWLKNSGIPVRWGRELAQDARTAPLTAPQKTMFLPSQHVHSCQNRSCIPTLLILTFMTLV